MAEVHSLIEGGYVCNGNWNLSQICGHLADWMRFPLDGFPVPPLPIKVIMYLMKVTVGPGMRQKILANGFSGGMMTAPETVPKPDAATDQEAADQLQAVIDRVKDFQGELHPSPLFGQMDHETHVQVSLLHAEHHLGYLEPKA